MTDVCIERGEDGETDIIGEHDWIEYEIRARLLHGVVRRTWRCSQCGLTRVTESPLDPADPLGLRELTP